MTPGGSCDNAARAAIVMALLWLQPSPTARRKLLTSPAAAASAPRQIQTQPRTEAARPRVRENRLPPRLHLEPAAALRDLQLPSRHQLGRPLWQIHLGPIGSALVRGGDSGEFGCTSWRTRWLRSPHTDAGELSPWWRPAGIRSPLRVGRACALLRSRPGLDHGAAIKQESP